MGYISINALYFLSSSVRCYGIFIFDETVDCNYIPYSMLFYMEQYHSAALIFLSFIS